VEQDEAWLRALLEACTNAIARLRSTPDPPPALIEDIERLRDDVAGRLGSTAPPEACP
jgi:hypothetical protein